MPTSDVRLRVNMCTAATSHLKIVSSTIFDVQCVMISLVERQFESFLKVCYLTHVIFSSYLYVRVTERTDQLCNSVFIYLSTDKKYVSKEWSL